MGKFVSSKLRSEEGADTVEIIIGIVVFAIFGLTVFSLITNVFGSKASDISNCVADSGSIIKSAGTNANTSKTCSTEDTTGNTTYTYNK